MHNIRLALRTLARAPFVTAIAALSIGLGIGANAAIYSLFHRLLLQTLDVPHADRLVNLGAPGPKPGSVSCSQAGSCELVFSYPMFRDLQQKRPAALTGLAAHSSLNANVAYDKQAFASGGLFVSGTYFPLLSVHPALGRLLGPADDDAPGANPVVVLSHRFWADKLGADAGVLGKTLMVNGKPFTIVGVTSAGFDGTTVGSRPSIYVPLSMVGTVGGWLGQAWKDRTAYWLYVFGRLAPGATIEQARAAINAVYQPIVRDVEAPIQTHIEDSTLARFRVKQATVTDGRRGQSDMSYAKAPLFMLFAVTGLVLLIACANIANLLLARATGREMEMAVRLSLGATRARLAAQLLTESLTLAAIGGVVSLLFAAWTLRGLAVLLPPEFSSSMDFSVSGAAVAFAALLSIGTGIAFGIFPAWHSTRPDLVSAMRNNSGRLAGGRGARRFRTSLATAQIALATLLLVGAGLFLESLWKISRVQLGVRVEQMAVFQLSAENAGYDSVRSRALFARVEQDLRAMPGAAAVTSARVPLVSGSFWSNGVTVEGGKKGGAAVNAVGPGFFRTIGVDVLAGREFTATDDSRSPKVAVVNEKFVKLFNLGANPIGKRMTSRTTRTGDPDTLTMDTEIVGVVRDSKYSGIKDSIPALVVTPHAQQNSGSMYFYVGSSGDLSTIMRQIPAVVRRIDPLLPVEHLTTARKDVESTVFVDRMIGTMSAAFALLATLLASIGLYGVLAYSVAQRTREIGVRMALGAAASQVRGMVLRQVGVMVLIGGVVGLAGAVALGRVARSLLFEMSGADPIVMAVAAALLSLVALAAGYLPALRASRVDPMQALRYE